MSIVLLPAAVFGLMALTRKFPPTERVAAGISAQGMFKEAFRPFFYSVVFMHVFDRGIGAGPRAMGGHGVDTNRRHEGHLASDLCQWPDVHHASFCRTAGP